MALFDDEPGIFAENPFPQGGPGLDFADFSPPPESKTSGKVGQNVKADAETVKQAAADVPAIAMGGVSDIGSVVVGKAEDEASDALLSPIGLFIGVVILLFALGQVLEVETSTGDDNGS